MAGFGANDGTSLPGRFPAPDALSSLGARGLFPSLTHSRLWLTALRYSDSLGFASKAGFGAYDGTSLPGRFPAPDALSSLGVRGLLPLPPSFSSLANGSLGPLSLTF